MFEHEQAQLMPMPREFDGYVETLCRVSSTCLVVVDGNRYSVPCEWVRQMISARVYLDLDLDCPRFHGHFVCVEIEGVRS